MKYRKKPVIVEAFQMTKEASAKPETWPEWLIEAEKKNPQEEGALWMESSGPVEGVYTLNDIMENEYKINTLEGSMQVSWGDYIIQGVRGELYPCKEEIFLATYDELTDADYKNVSVTSIPQWL